VLVLLLGKACNQPDDKPDEYNQDSGRNSRKQDPKVGSPRTTILAEGILAANCGLRQSKVT
jgi:hypothetical protein